MPHKGIFLLTFNILDLRIRYAGRQNIHVFIAAKSYFAHVCMFMDFTVHFPLPQGFVERLNHRVFL